jgi:hypothetical protein
MLLVEGGRSLLMAQLKEKRPPAKWSILSTIALKGCLKDPHLRSIIYDHPKSITTV